MPLEPLGGCPENVVNMPNTFCVSDKYAGDIMWRHTETAIPGKVVSKFFLLLLVGLFTVAFAIILFDRSTEWWWCR